MIEASASRFASSGNLQCGAKNAGIKSSPAVQIAMPYKEKFLAEPTF